MLQPLKGNELQKCCNIFSLFI